MIKSVEIANFQSHPDTFIEFDKGLNVLTGSSRSGKSTVRRAIMWCITNRPVGNGIVSWWAKKNDKITKECRVTITLDNGTVISRVKSTELNGYIINGKVLEAVATGVPEEIAHAFNMSDVNYAGQFDAPYLISQSPGYVAQYLNDIVNLEAVDHFQNEVESRRRKCVQTTEATNKDILRLEEASKDFTWLARAEELITRIKEKEEKLKGLTEQIDEILWLEHAHKEAKTTVNETRIIVLKANKLIGSIQEKVTLANKYASEISQIESLQRTYTDAKTHADVPIDKMDKCIKRITRQLALLNTHRAELAQIELYSTQYASAVAVFAASGKERKQVQRELDLIDICPLCGSKKETASVPF